MITKLRFRFIRITMIAVFVVLAIIICTINIVNITRNNRALDAITQRLADHSISIPSRSGPTTPPNFDFSGFNRGRRLPFQNEKELPFSTRFFSIRVGEDNEIIDSDLRQIASVGETDLEQIRDGILKENARVGWYHSYRYRVSDTNTGHLLTVLEATSTLSSMMYVLFLTVFIGVLTFAVLFAIIAVFSKRAIRPIAEAYDKQRQFITDASHELKTPLTVISANAEILSLSHGKNEWCEGIVRQADTMRDLIGQMIQMAKLDEGDTVREFALFDLSDAVYDTALSFQTLAAHRGLRLNIEITPELSLIGNEAAIRQVVAILMDNAVKYCDTDGEISIRLRPSGKKGGATLDVENSFSAVNSLDTERLFDRFYRGDKARERPNSFGLGLSIAKSIVEQHRGLLECKKQCGNKIQFCAFFGGKRLSP